MKASCDLITVEDVPSIVRALQNLREESPVYNEVPNDPELVTRKLNIAFEHYMFGVIMKHEDGRVIGFMFGAMGEAWYHDIIEAHEQLLYIAPDFRGSHYVTGLIRVFEDQCRARGAKRLYTGSSLGICDELVESLYARLGYRWIGRSLAKDL